MRVAITGSTGLIGSALVQALRWRGDEVLRLTRRAAAGPDERQWWPDQGRIDGPGLADVDAVVNLAGEPLTGRWTDKRKSEILSSRVDATRTVVAALTPDGRCQRLLNGSAISYYGDAGDTELDEDSPRGTGFLADVVVRWEEAAAGAPVSTALLRTGLVMTPRGGFLGQILGLFQLGLGGRMGDGSQWQAWISLDDQVAAMIHLLTSPVEGPVNLTAPQPVTNKRLTAALGQALRRPTVLPLPVPAVRVVMGDEMVDQAMLASQRVLPRRLLADHFSFLDMEIEPALDRLLANE